MGEYPKNDLVKDGLEALKKGNRTEARKLLYEAIKINPNNETAWVGMYRAVEKHEQKQDCLRQILRINPENQVAYKLLYGKDLIPWYRDRTAYILFFLFLTPVWSLLIFTDKRKQSIGVKILAGFFGIIFMLALFNLCLNLTIFPVLYSGAKSCILVVDSACSPLDSVYYGEIVNICDRPLTNIVLTGAILSSSGIQTSSDAGSPNSPVLGPGDSSIFIFGLTGAYSYGSYCDVTVKSARYLR